MAYFRRKSLINVLLLAQLTQAIILLPPFGNRTYVQPGKDVIIPWNYTDLNYNLAVRKWFYRNNTTSDFKQLMYSIGTSTPVVSPSSPLTNIEVKNKATLVLKNVTMKYNGTYKFEINLLVGKTPPSSDVFVIIQENPVAIVDCSNAIFLKEGENVSCLCNSEKGNPPPTASWSRNGKLIGKTGHLRKNLILVNVSKKDSGIYKCTARSHTLTAETYVTVTVISQQNVFSNCSSNEPIKANEGETVACLCSANGENPRTVSWVKDKDGSVINGKMNFKNTLLFPRIQRANRGTYWCKVEYFSLSDQIAINIIVTYMPVINCFTPDVSSVILGSPITITCIADGYPQPKYTLFHNRTKILENNEKVVYTITRFSYNNAGEYQCQVTNNLGSTMNRINLKVQKILPTVSSGNGSKPDAVDCGTKWYIYIITLIGGILLGLVISYVTSLIRHRKKNTKEPTHPAEYAVPDSHSEQTRNIPVYQELDLKDMNKEDNYQSLKRNAGNAKNNEVVVEKESGYQELNKVREKGDDNYQSLNRA